MSSSDALDELPRTTIPWSAGRWTTAPVAVATDGADIVVTAAEGSDAWRTTSYGFIHSSEHALLAPLSPGTAMEVTFRCAFDSQFDQAGVFVSVSESTWVKAGVECADGIPQVGAVVTREVSDWSVAPVPEWADRLVTVRASRSGDALTVRARADDERFRLVRVAPLDPDIAVHGGPFCCAPTRAGLSVRFTRWTATPADPSLH